MPLAKDGAQIKHQVHRRRKASVVDLSTSNNREFSNSKTVENYTRKDSLLPTIFGSAKEAMLDVSLSSSELHKFLSLPILGKRQPGMKEGFNEDIISRAIVLLYKLKQQFRT